MASKNPSRGGNQKAVRRRRKPRVRSEQVELKKRGAGIGAREEAANLSAAYELLTGFSSDFFNGGRRQPRFDERLGVDTQPPDQAQSFPRKRESTCGK